MSQLRLNPLVGRWVTIVSSRGERPTDFAPRTLQVEAYPARPCPFCSADIDAGPPIASYDRDDQWQVRVVPNRYPAFDGDESMAVHNLGPVHVQADASGLHEVLVLSPEHSGSWGELDDGDVAIVMQALSDRLAVHAAMPSLRYTQAIVNHGREAGASLTHPHGQLLGIPFVPGEILDEERAFSRFEGGCILCTTVEAELAEGVRVVVATPEALVVSPFWAGTPYELLIIPTSHDAHLQDGGADELAAVGRAIRDALQMLGAVHGDLAYNLVFHTAPHHHDDGAFHWHAHLWPKLVTVAGFERGTGVLINIVPPEEAAAELRRVSPLASSI